MRSHRAFVFLLSSLLAAGCAATTADAPPMAPAGSPTADAPPASVESTAAAPTDVGELTLRDFAPIEFNARRLIVRGPSVVGFDGHAAVVEFETSVPTPASVVRFGPLTSAGGVVEALHRKVSREDLAPGETAVSHRIEMDVARLESPAYDLRYIEDGGGDVAFRLEVYDPDAGAVRLYDRRFRYVREGPRRTGDYSLAATMTFGPFLDLVGPDSFVVSWETDVPAAGAVVLGDTAVVDASVARVHEVEVGSLRPDTEYLYRVRYGPGGALTDAFSARTAPAPGAPAGRFTFASDSRGGAGGGEHEMEGVNHSVLRAVLTGAVSRGAGFVLFGGDLIDGYTTSEDVFRGELDSWKRAAGAVASSVPIYEGVGNHEELGDYFAAPEPDSPDRRFIVHRDRDGSRSAESVFSSEFVNPVGSCYGFCVRPETVPHDGETADGPDYGETVYSFNRGNCHFVSINTNYWFTGVMYDGTTVRYPSDKEGTATALRVLGGNREGYVLPNQLAWLSADLAAAESDDDVDWVFVYGHEPAFPNGGHLYDAMFWGSPGRGGEGGLNDQTVPLGDVIDMRNRFWSILASSPKVVAFMCGDEHNYSRTLIDADVDPAFTHPVWHIVSGGAGAPFYARDASVPWADKVEAFATLNHYCLFEADRERVSLSVYTPGGVLLDEVEDLTAHGPE